MSTAAAGPYLVVGLGNPGRKYEATRHNLGFETIDRLADKHRVSVDRSRDHALLGELREGGRRVILCKPQTFMNLSGEAAGPIVRFFGVDLSNVLAVYDELALPLGRIRLLGKGSAGGHNGMKSLIDHFGTQDFARLRLGVGPKPPQWDQVDFVLSRFSSEERKLVDEVIGRAVEAVESWLDKGLDETMNRFNGV